MELDKNASLNKRTDKLYKFCVFLMKIITPTGNLIRNLPIPVPRSGHRIVFYKGNVFAFGGYSPRDPESDEIIDQLDNRRLFKELWKFNFATKTWFYIETDGTMPMELASHAAVLVENCMLVYGGTGLPFGQSSSNSTHLCNLDSLEWINLSTTGDQPQPLYGQGLSRPLALDYTLSILESNSVLPVLSHYKAVALHNGKLYVVGGTTGYDYTISVHCLDLKTKVWTRLDNLRKHSILPSSRYRHEIAILEDQIFVFGGGTVSESFNLNEISMNNQKNLHFWEFVKKMDKICYFKNAIKEEAHGAQALFLPLIPTFSLKEKTWSVSVTTTTSVFPEARRCHGSVQIGSDVFICGGHDGQTIYSDIWKINLKKLQWNKLKVELPIPLYFHSVAVSPEGQLFSFGGVTDTEGEVRTNALYSVWLTIPSLSDICWEAVLSYIPNIGLMDKQKLYKLGVPLKYIQQIDFYTNNRRKRKQAPLQVQF